MGYYSDISSMSILSNYDADIIESREVSYGDIFDVNMPDVFNINSLESIESIESIRSLTLNTQSNIDNDLYSIMDFYTQDEIDNKVIEPIMQLPLSPNQLVLMKKQWNELMDIELNDVLPKQFLSWPRYSYKSEKSSNKSAKSFKSWKSWKSFFNKSSKNSIKNKISFYGDLIHNY